MDEERYVTGGGVDPQPFQSSINSLLLQWHVADNQRVKRCIARRKQRGS